MNRKYALFLGLVLLAAFPLSGCRFGLGIGVEARVGVIYFLSSRDDVFGRLYLNGGEVGYLFPHTYLGKWVFLDFRHQVELYCEHCGAVHSMVINPPLYAGQVITLDFAHQE